MGIDYDVDFFYGIALTAFIDEDTKDFEHFEDDVDKWFEQYKSQYPHLELWRESNMGDNEDFEYRLGMKFGHIDGRDSAREEVKMPDPIPISEINTEINAFKLQFHLTTKQFEGPAYYLTFDMD